MKLRVNPKKYACTIVSLLPYEPMPEHKPHIIPSTFQIPAADPVLGFGLLYVEEGMFFIPNVFDEKNNYRQTTTPAEMARSIVEDYSGAQLSIDPDAGPGLFWLEGAYSEEEVQKDEEVQKTLKEYQARQTRWFKNLVFMADGDWVKNRNVMAVSDLQRHAARALNIKREWVDMTEVQTSNCWACKTPITPDVIKCPNCHEIVNPQLYKEMQDKQKAIIGGIDIGKEPSFTGMIPAGAK